MVAQLENLDQQMNDVARDFPGQVIAIRYSISHDWNSDPAIFFRILLSDDASRPETLPDITGRVTETLFDNLHLRDSDYTPYFNFRGKSEQEKLKDPEWESLMNSSR